MSDVRPIRVLHVLATDRRRGAEVFADDLIRRLRGDGLEHRVAVLRPADAGAMMFGVETSRLGPNRGRIPGTGTDLGVLRALDRLVDSWAPDVVQAYGSEPFRYALLAGRLRRRLPVIYTRIGWAAPWATRGPRRVAHGVLMRRAARIITVAEAVRRETLDVFHVPSERVETIPSGRDATAVRSERSREEVRRDLGIPEDATVVLSLGALVWEKDPLAHLEVARRARDEAPDMIHLVVGDGPLRGELETAAREFGDAVRIAGPVPDTAAVLAASDLILLASKSEGMPVVLIEAGMAGLPAAAYAIAGVPEVVVDGETGLLAPPGDVAALSSAVARLGGDPETRRSMGKAARDRCMARFEIGPIAARYRQVYERLARRG